MNTSIISWCREQIWSFLSAISFFTRLPVPKSVHSLPLNRATPFFPAVGWVIAAISGGVYWILKNWTPLTVELAVLLSMGASLYITGAFHEDGLADSVDGLGGGYYKDDVLRIMRDSRIGSFGTIALVMALLLKYQMLISYEHSQIVSLLFIAHPLSRLMAVSYIYTLPYVSLEGKSKDIANTITFKGLCFASVIGIAPLFLFNHYQQISRILIFLLLLHLMLGQYYRKRMGGYTGDILGMSQQIFELTIYLMCLLSYLAFTSNWSFEWHLFPELGDTYKTDGTLSAPPEWMNPSPENENSKERTEDNNEDLVA